MGWVSRRPRSATPKGASCPPKRRPSPDAPPAPPRKGADALFRQPARGGFRGDTCSLGVYREKRGRSMEGAPTSDLARAGVVVANRYRLDAVIGRGGMGSVWSATHLGLGHRIAIKLISREFIRSADALRRFDAEAKAAARLQSRPVVQ